ncbi:right-handed parallel beta-helix repeat-containing protein [Leptothoe spongobia]|uniref:Right-handed parallel beta-helix repeat-containing protein n=1 Tax=Leptothoe spongobia TAU-MAC 1115 TaxID=1967444 RepID=A0A947GL60_9CYAN|nr:right-handed parallel beta-helix repeat-containing protein [Leptothoe spongobia]MBT9314816.1 right-handed parallel beta-helix repeat-containing protein [Leptothoe spongobia TAU-MAC 1115]
MFFSIPVADFAATPTLAYVAPSATSIVASAPTNKASEGPTTIDITNLPQAVFEAHPGLDNAVANDGRDDAETIQAVLKWLKARRTAGNTQPTTIYIPAGTFDLANPLKVQTANITIKGAGPGQTILKNAPSFKVGTQGLPDGETVFDSINQDAYLFTVKEATNNVSFMNMTVSGPTIHGAILSGRNQGLVVKNLEFNDFLWSSVRLFEVRNAKIHNNVFIDAGGQSEGNSGITGGSIFATYLKNSEIYNNKISKSRQREGNVYGIKGREFRDTRIYNNTINTNFAIELPFENDYFVEIDHNYLNGAISVPKFAGGEVPKDGFTFHIHHNYFTRSYSLEWARNGAEVDHNVFVFDPDKDGGNLISNFASEPANGPTKFHNNLIVNPGRGIVWHENIYNNFSFYNNEVIANKTKTPRTAGLFGFHEKTDFSTIAIKNNLIKINGVSRPLMRNQQSYGATIENNQLVNVSDANKFDNPSTGATRGLTAPLAFQVGANGEFAVNGQELITHANSKTLTAQTRWSPKALFASIMGIFSQYMPRN